MMDDKGFRFVALKVTETIRVINPEFAHKLLKYNPKNRLLNHSHVRGLASQMEQGLFIPELGFISFDKKGQMIDGQHRLNAIIESQTSFKMKIITGLNPDVRNIIDTGLKRSLADILRMDGIENAGVVSGAIAKIIIFGETGRFDARLNRKLHNADFKKAMKKHPEIVICAEKLRPSAIFRRPAQILTLYSLCYKVAPRKADDFFLRLMTGENLEKNSSLLEIRRIVLNKIGTRNNIAMPDLIFALISVWNASRKGKSYDVGRINQAPRGKELPKII